MFCDIFNKEDAKKLLAGKKIWFMGSSNMRAIYKDLIWLLTEEKLTPQQVFKTKNEPFYLTDKRLSKGVIHNGVNYVETREKNGNPYLFFHFLTRIYSDSLVKLIEKTKKEDIPDVLFINSTIWDLSRYGSTEDCIAKFKENLVKTLKLLTKVFPNTRIIWKTCLPIDRSATGAIFTDEVKDVVPMVPWHIIEANRYAAVTAQFFNVDVLDFHHHMHLCGYHRVKDGIHWNSDAVRYLTNVFLSHLALCWDSKLPGVYKPTNFYLSETSSLKLEQKALEERYDQKKDFITRLFNKAVKVVKKTVKKNPIKKAKNLINNCNKIKDLKNKICDGRNRYNVHDRGNTVSNNFTSNKFPSNFNNNYNFVNPYSNNFVPQIPYYNSYENQNFNSYGNQNFNSYGNQNFNSYGNQNFNFTSNNIYENEYYTNLQFNLQLAANVARSLNDSQINMVFNSLNGLF